MSKHTPGKWVLVENKKIEGVYRFIDRDYLSREPLAKLSSVCSDHEAQLMVCAPEMFDLLREVAEEFRPYSGNVGAPGSSARAKHDAEKALYAKIKELVGRLK